MAAILAANVAYSIIQRKKLEDNRQHNHLTIVFGNGALTYPTGGVPLTPTQMGLPRGDLNELLIEDASHADGYVYKYDYVNQKIKMFQAPASGPAVLTEIPNSTAPAATTLSLVVIGS